MQNNTKINVRKEFLKFFEERGHKPYGSYNLVPDDASLLFTNAGMVQFKDIFTGTRAIPTPPRATSSQLCIRAGGKHNDLENVGYTARHHTLFEMLGNFSFGDYFKEKAIEYAYTFVVEVLKFEKERLFVTVHKDDEEAYKIWQKYFTEDKIKKLGDKDNFWQMGDTGPCGPCSEIFYDQGEEFFNSSEDYFGGDGDRFLEIWNLVFMQFERDIEGNLKPLPKPSIDTGMGLERVVALLEGKRNNFDSSIFMPLIKKVENLSSKKYTLEEGASFRVIADHIRAVGFLLSQGVTFSSDGRGYVLRRILRRAVRHGYLLGFTSPFLYKLIDTLVAELGDTYVQLAENIDFIKEQTEAEEKRFFSTLSTGIDLFNKELKQISGTTFSGEVAFRLYDTYGFPLDLTQDMLKTHNLTIDMKTFEKYMKEQKINSRAAWKGSGDEETALPYQYLEEKFKSNNFVGHESKSANCKVLALIDKDFNIVNVLDDEGFVLFDITPLNAKGGGSIGERGLIYRLDKKGEVALVGEIIDTTRKFNLTISKVVPQATLKTNETLNVSVSNREAIARAHSATHLLHLALREKFSNIAQAGSLVDEDRLRFDFTSNTPIDEESLREIEAMVNGYILEAQKSKIETMDIQTAKNSGAVALFNEKYADLVRVVSIGKSKEFCGGMHIKSSSEIGSFYILKESGVSSGVRRIEALSGAKAYEFSKGNAEKIKLALEILKNKDLIEGCNRLKDENQRLKIELKNLNKDNNIKINSVECGRFAGLKYVIGENNGEIKEASDNIKNQHKAIFILLFKEIPTKNDDNKINFIIASKGEGITAKAFLQLAKSSTTDFMLNGGGRDDFITGSAINVSKDEFLNFANKIFSGIINE